MSKNTVMWIAILGGAYYFLSTRAPIFAQQADGTFIPASLIDRLTVTITGAQPPPPVNSTANVLVNAATTLIKQIGATT
jgi:hypothetical protein